MGGLRILIVHNSYQQRGGEDVVVEEEVKLLRGAGYTVELELVSNSQINSILEKAKSFVSAPFNFEAKARAARLVNTFNPDLVHIHNFFPLLSPALHYYFAELGVPIVQTIHNYRLMCANATFLRDGKVCELCFESKINAVKYRCYRESLVASLAVVGMQKSFVLCEKRNPGKIIYIALTNFAKDKLIQGGIADEQIKIKPNFLEDLNEEPFVTNRIKQVLFVGRLSREKGAEFLVSTWSKIPDTHLIVAGDGPMREYLESIAPINVEFIGQASSVEIKKLMKQSSALIFPSLWYEGLPMTILEAFRSGLPVIASDLGAMSEVIQHGYNGMLFPAGDERGLRDAIETFFSSDPASLRVGARESFVSNYTPQINLLILQDIYKNAIESRF